MKNILLALALLFVGNMACRAADYASDHVKAAVEKLRLSVDSLGEGETRLNVSGVSVVVRKLAGGDIDHVGMPLFHADLRRAQPLPIYDFLEYACLDRRFGVSSNKLLYKDVVFVKGNWNTLVQLGDSADCSVVCVADRVYEVRWSRGGRVMADVKVPVRYDVLSLSSRGELEARFISGLKRFEPAVPVGDVVLTSGDGLEEVADSGMRFFMAKGASYADCRITNSTYYVKADSIASCGDSAQSAASPAFVPLFDRRFPAQTVGNMMVLSSWDKAADARVQLRFVCANHKVVEATATMRQLVAYAESMGCKPYYGVESCKDGWLVMSLFLYNAQCGYDHVLKIECAADDVAADGCVLSGRAYLFSPTTNVKRR